MSECTVQTTDRYIDKNNKSRFTGNVFLKKSQSWPKLFVKHMLFFLEKTLGRIFGDTVDGKNLARLGVPEKFLKLYYTMKRSGAWFFPSMEMFGNPT